MTYLDYVKAAFNFRLRMPGLGGLPINWLFLAVVGVASAALPPVLLVGAAAETAWLAGMASSSRFQRIVRSQRFAERGLAGQLEAARLVSTLTKGSQAKFADFRGACDSILDIARRIGRARPEMIDTYVTHLGKFRELYARMLAMLEMFSGYAREWEQTDPLPQMKRIEKELEAQDLSDAVRHSREALLAILKKRAEARQAISDRSHMISSELTRLEEQVQLLRDQALLTRDPAALTESMDATAGMLEENTNWMQENADLLQSLEQIEEQA